MRTRACFGGFSRCSNVAGQEEERCERAVVRISCGLPERHDPRGTTAYAEDELRLSSAGTATTVLRSSWFGPSTVTARSVPFEDATIQVEFLFPWIFLGIALLGGVLGGAAGWLSGKEGASATRRVVRSAFLGLIAAVLFAVGVNVTPFNPTVTTGQAVVFGVAAVMGFLGTFKMGGSSGLVA